MNFTQEWPWNTYRRFIIITKCSKYYINIGGFTKEVGVSVGYKLKYLFGFPW